jgi:hypothetical protein
VVLLQLLASVVAEDPTKQAWLLAAGILLCLDLCLPLLPVLQLLASVVAEDPTKQAWLQTAAIRL